MLLCCGVNVLDYGDEEVALVVAHYSGSLKSAGVSVHDIEMNGQR